MSGRHGHRRRDRPAAWVFGFIFFALIWLMSRPRKRQCPRCGEDVKKGKTACPSCQFDFASIGMPSAAEKHSDVQNVP
jgi:predicted amidophosphoribosyltransferase